jgi:hypothetical protein
MQVCGHGMREHGLVGRTCQYSTRKPPRQSCTKVQERQVAGQQLLGGTPTHPITTASESMLCIRSTGKQCQRPSRTQLPHVTRDTDTSDTHKQTTSRPPAAYLVPVFGGQQDACVPPTLLLLHTLLLYLLLLLRPGWLLCRCASSGVRSRCLCCCGGAVSCRQLGAAGW